MAVHQKTNVILWQIRNSVTHHSDLAGLTKIPQSSRINRWDIVCKLFTGLILGSRPDNEKRRYKVTPPLIGCAQTWISPVFITVSTRYICGNRPLLLFWGHNVMTSSSGKTFALLALWGESIGQRWIPVTKAGVAELWYFLWSAPEQTVEQTIETPVIWDAMALSMTSL